MPGHTQIRVRVEIMGSQKCRIVRKSQSVLNYDQYHYLHPHPYITLVLGGSGSRRLGGAQRADSNITTHGSGGVPARLYMPQCAHWLPRWSRSCAPARQPRTVCNGSLPAAAAPMVAKRRPVRQIPRASSGPDSPEQRGRNAVATRGGCVS
jgi:hypothetical protein